MEKENSNYKIDINLISYLIEELKKYIVSMEEPSYIFDLLEKNSSLLNDFIENFEDEKFEILIDEIIDKFCDIEDAIDDNSQEKIKECIRELEEINLKFIEKVKENIENEPLEEYGNKELIEMISKDLTEERINTENFIKIKNALDQYTNKLISADKFRDIIYDLINIIRTTRDEYQNSYISIDEWTEESKLGDTLLMEGLNEWEDALEIMDEHIDNMDIDKMQESLNNAFNANKKLVMVQLLSNEVNEMTQDPNNLIEFKE